MSRLENYSNECQWSGFITVDCSSSYNKVIALKNEWMNKNAAFYKKKKD